MSVRHRASRPGVSDGELTRMADGTLASPQREHLKLVIAASPELQHRLRDQRRAVAAARWAAQRERAPLAVRVRHRALRSRRRSRRPAFLRRPRLRLGLGLGLAGPVAAVALAVTLIGGAEPGLTVAQAAALATRPALAAVPEPADRSTTLPGLRAAGLPFPYWEDRFGWRATGTRTDRIGGRLLTTVFYRRGAQGIAYTIVSGTPLAASPGATGPNTVTWLRYGHTCVLSGRGVAVDELIKLVGGGETS
jgi:anti-sigma factor RsiW